MAGRFTVNGRRRRPTNFEETLIYDFEYNFYLAKVIGSDEIFSFIEFFELGLGTAKTVEFLLSREVPTSDLELILKTFSSRRFHAWGMRKFINAFHRPYPTTQVALLIRYGFPYKFDKIYFEECVTDVLEYTEVDGKFLRDEISERIMDFGNLRLQMTLDILQVIFSDYPQLMVILELLWRAVPFPYISSTEMFTLLEPFYEGEHLKEVCNKYKERNTLYEVPEVTQPRSLQHLSRIQVRKSMCDANSIGDEAIDSLNIHSYET